ncbi:hypothetical protein ACFHW2_11230 [Actinomadura sp. LOL_016]|uniref:hypothetical protein n=1 Tax=unclassified Actinomadura TaxID=2626254 RepID=UPI003A7FE84C
MAVYRPSSTRAGQAVLDALPSLVAASGEPLAPSLRDLQATSSCAASGLVRTNSCGSPVVSTVPCDQSRRNVYTVSSRTRTNRQARSPRGSSVVRYRSGEDQSEVWKKPSPAY